MGSAADSINDNPEPMPDFRKTLVNSALYKILKGLQRGAGPSVTIGIDTELMMPPMMAGTFFRSTSWRAWSTATEPWL